MALGFSYDALASKSKSLGVSGKAMAKKGQLKVTLHLVEGFGGIYYATKKEFYKYTLTRAGGKLIVFV